MFRSISQDIYVTSSRILYLRLTNFFYVVWPEKSQAVKSSKPVGHYISLFREIMLFGNKSIRIFMSYLAILFNFFEKSSNFTLSNL